jgi:serine/threonine-protein kinase
MAIEFTVYNIGDLIDGQYVVRQRLSGGMGYVYIVLDQQRQVSFAIKTIKEDLTATEDFRLRFEREALNWIELVSDAPHENIVSALEFRSTQTPPLLFLEYIDGISLKRLLSYEPRGLAFGEVLDFASQIASGLAHAHQHGLGKKRCVIHRDLKPENIMITRNKIAKITDFGLSRAQGDNVLESSYEGWLGTPPYMPPEQFATFHWVTEKADVFSFGATIYEMITGTKAFQSGRNRDELREKITMCEPPPIQGFRPDVDLRLVELISWCMQKHPVDRPTTPDVLAELAVVRDAYEPRSATLPECHGCCYVANREHQICPICNTLQVRKKTAPAWSCRCGLPVAGDFRFCIHCGLDGETPAACLICGIDNPAKYRFCCGCGKVLASSA